MAVFTPVEEADAEPFIRRFGLGALRALTPIAEGVSNTNYQIETDGGRFVLTLFESRTDEAALPFCLGLTAHAAEAGLPCARPLRDSDGEEIGRLNGRPAAILEWLPGTWKRTFPDRSGRRRSLARPPSPRRPGLSPDPRQPDGARSEADSVRALRVTCERR
jgi:Ser/Thr protein kinase RdoA (MazF antagonist)